MWKKTFLFLGIFIVAFCIGYCSGCIVNEVWKVKDFEFWLGMLFTFLSIVAVYCAIKIRDKKIMKEIHNNQIKVEPSKKFPLYKAYSIKLILTIALLGFLPLLIISFCESIFLDNATFHTIAVNIYRISPFCIILSYILILLKPHIYFGKGGLLFFEKELSLKFNIIDKKSLPNEEIKNLPEEVSASEDVIKRFRKCLRCIVKLKYEYYEYLKMYYEGFKVYVGVIEKKKYLRTSNTRSWRVESDIFFSFEVPYNFKYATYVGFPRNLSEINDIEGFKADIIVPKYNNISTIFYENKEYTQKILSEIVQKKISDLNIEIKNVELCFNNNKIIVIIPKARWSTPFSKIFCPKRNAEKIVKVIETVLVSLKDISDEIEKSEEY